jgi:hypothetical protein
MAQYFFGVCVPVFSLDSGTDAPKMGFANCHAWNQRDCRIAGGIQLFSTHSMIEESKSIYDGALPHSSHCPEMDQPSQKPWEFNHS